MRRAIAMLLKLPLWAFIYMPVSFCGTAAHIVVFAIMLGDPNAALINYVVFLVLFHLYQLISQYEVEARQRLEFNTKVEG